LKLEVIAVEGGEVAASRMEGFPAQLVHYFRASLGLGVHLLVGLLLRMPPQDTAAAVQLPTPACYEP
jgi:hypothetical protein